MVLQRLSLILALVCATWVGAGAAQAGSPWVLPGGESVFQLDFRSERGDREFLPSGTNQRFPLNGRYSGQSLSLTLRQGLGAGFEASVETSYKSVSYISDTVTVVASPDGPQLLPSFSLSDQASGLGDVFISTRYNVYQGAVVVTPEIKVKIPTGYAPPSGTFEGDDPGLVTDEDGNFVENTRGDVPVADDLTLGTGQVDVTGSLLLGTFIPATRSFARLGGGLRLRLGGPGHQVVYDAKVGQILSKYFIFFVGVDGAKTLNRGEVIGTSFTTSRPSIDASAFPVGDLQPIDLRIDSDHLQAFGGFIFKPGAYEIILSGGKVLDGANITEVVFTSLATSYKF
jgi:hypothetical protein